MFKIVLLALSLLLLSSCAVDSSTPNKSENTGTIEQKIWYNWTPLNYAAGYTNKIERIKFVAVGTGFTSEPHLIVAVGVENGTNKLHYAILDGVNPENGRDENYNLINPVWIPVGNASNYNIISVPSFTVNNWLIYIYGIHLNKSTGQYIPVRTELNKVTRNNKYTWVSHGYWSSFSSGFIPRPSLLNVVHMYGQSGGVQGLLAFQVSASYEPDIYDYSRMYYSKSSDNGATWYGPHRMGNDGDLINKSSTWVEGFTSSAGSYGGVYALFRPQTAPSYLYSARFLLGTSNCNYLGSGGPHCWSVPTQLPNPTNTLDGSIFAYGFTGVVPSSSTYPSNWSSWTGGHVCLTVGRKPNSYSKESQYQICGAPVYSNDMSWWVNTGLGDSSSDPNHIPRNVGLSSTNIVNAYMTRSCFFDTVKVMSNGSDTGFRKHFVRCVIP